ncbi:unnamed protein product [Penicillium pancosmium]
MARSTRNSISRRLAIEYSHRVRSESPATWVFWVHASNEARFEQSFRDIADQIKLPGRRNPRVNIFQLVENWLRDERKGKWICVLDNIDDEPLCFLAGGKDDPTEGPTNASTKPLLEYVPRSPNGFTIITSRSREVALRMVEHKDLVEVQPMERLEALDLLQKKLEQPGHSRENRQLVDALDFMPLAIVQAASYIRSRAPRYSVAQYLNNFQKSDREATKLLRKEVGHIYRDWEANNSILVTWQISFDYIRRTTPSAAELLSLMSFFDRQGIPENLIRYPLKANKKLHSEPLDDSSDEESSSDIGPDFEDDVTTLRHYSFISVSEDSRLFMMHRLVQLSIRAWLKSHGQVEQWREKFIKNLAKEFPSDKYENWGKCRTLYPHVKCAMSQRPESPGCLLELAALLYRGAWYASENGFFGDMMEMALESRKQRVKLLGAEDKTALQSTEMLAIAYRSQRRWEEAEQLQVQVIETRKTKLGHDHPDTLNSMHNLASTYRKQGRWEEAEQLFVQVMETTKAKLGEDHPDTLMSMHNLASTYGVQGQWEKAEQLFVQVIETTKAKLGEDHPSTLASMHELASTHWKQGRWEKAEQLFVQVMETRKTKLGDHHPHTLTSTHNLASTYRKQGRWEEAEQLQVQVMETRKTKLGDHHPDTLTSMASLAFTWKYSGRRADAVELLRTCSVNQEQILGPNHPSTLSNSRTLLEWETEALNINA